MLLAMLVLLDSILQMQLFQINQSEDSSKITIMSDTTCGQLRQRPITSASNYISVQLQPHHSTTTQDNSVEVDRPGSIGNGTCNISRLGLEADYLRQVDREDEDWSLGAVLTAALDQLFQPPALVREMIVVLMTNSSRFIFWAVVSSAF